MKNPTTDEHLGVNTRHEKFADIRAKAHEELEERYRKAKRDKTVKIPKYKVDAQVVVASAGWPYTDRRYMLIEIIDFYDEYKKDFCYFGVILKVSKENDTNRIGHLLEISEGRGWYRWSIENILPGDIKWL